MAAPATRSQKRPLQRRYAVGAEPHADGVHFRVWAPAAQRVAVLLHDRGETVGLSAEADGYWSELAPGVPPGAHYSFLLDERGPFPDPASRFQPDGPHGPSQVVDPKRFAWKDHAWRGVTRTGQILYELHIGTFTKEGTWRAALAQLDGLAETGVTVIQVMPVAEFAGRFGWGYDGVGLFAPSHLYGTPDDMRAFVDRAHAFGLGVILDVVYNHVGPDGNYLKEFAPQYFTTRYQNEWGEAINYDGRDAGPVREFFTTNAAHWIDEYHLDGLRLDATQQIFDASSRNILADVSTWARAAARERSIFIVAENEPQHTRLLRSNEADGYELDALFNDDFHHSARVALTGKREAYYSDHRGTPQELVSALKYGFLFQGQFYAWQALRRGTPTRGLSADRFVHFLENHDQVANSSAGARLHQLTDPAHWRALTAVLLLGPQTPLLFQGQEFAAATPFLYFADHHAGLADAVAKGRADFLAQFSSAAGAVDSLAAPDNPETFERCKLNHAERARNSQAWQLHADLIRLRKTDDVFARAHELDVDGAVIETEAFVLRYFGHHTDRLLIVNLGPALALPSLAEPLIAPPAGTSWQLLWSSEDARYGGAGVAPLERDDAWHIAAHSTTVLAATYL